MLFRVESEIPPTVQIRLKVEINCFEHFNVLGLTKIPLKVENSWFTGEAELTTYHFEELLGTKLRALYQRKKGRDLFDLVLQVFSFCGKYNEKNKYTMYLHKKNVLSIL